MLSATFPVQTTILATGDGLLGRGVRGPIPLQLLFASNDFTVQPDRPLKCRLAITVHAEIHPQPTQGPVS